MVLVGMPSIGTGIVGSGIVGSGIVGSGAGVLLEPPHAVNETVRNAANTILFSDVFKFVPTLAYAHTVLVQCC